MNEPIRFARSLYEPAAVAESVRVYADLARFELSEGADELRLAIHDPDPDVAHLLADELCNHALIGTIVARQSKGTPS